MHPDEQPPAPETEENGKEEKVPRLAFAGCDLSCLCNPCRGSGPR